MPTTTYSNEIYTTNHWSHTLQRVLSNLQVESFTHQSTHFISQIYPPELYVTFFHLVAPTTIVHYETTTTFHWTTNDRHNMLTVEAINKRYQSKSKHGTQLKNGQLK